MASVISKQSSFRSQGTSDSAHSDASKSILQKEAMDYDRRQIRRIVADKLKERGIDPEEETAELGEDFDDEESVYDDTEFFPWKQREAAVHAAAVGGKTEGRMEGFDSLERALQAHHHQLHYGRGRSFGWSAQQKSASSSLMQKQAKLQSIKQLTDWTSFQDLDKGDDASTATEKTEVDNAAKDVKAAKKRSRNSTLLSTLFILIALGATLGFAYYIETIKINSYQSYLPKGYDSRGAPIATSGQEASDSQAGFVEAAEQSANAANSARRSP